MTVSIHVDIAEGLWDRRGFSVPLVLYVCINSWGWSIGDLLPDARSASNATPLNVACSLIFAKKDDDEVLPRVCLRR